MKCRLLFALLYVSIVVAGVSEPGKTPDLTPLALAQDYGPNFSPWSQAVDVGPPISTNSTWEGCPFISKNGLDLYHRREIYDVGLKVWHWDIFVSHRDSVEDPWEEPINLGPNINTANKTGSRHELCSFVTIDGHWLYFVSNRQDLPYVGGYDIWVSHRKNKRDDTGWETPINLGPIVNTTGSDTGPSIFEDEATGQVVLYFTKSVSGKNKIYSCQMLDKVTPGLANPVAELNKSGYNDLHAFIRRRDGLEVIFASDRDSAIPGVHDLFVSTRPTISDPWSEPINLGLNVNSSGTEIRPSISWDGTILYFWTNRGGTMDVYQAFRTKLTGKNK